MLGTQGSLYTLAHSICKAVVRGDRTFLAQAKITWR